MRGLLAMAAGVLGHPKTDSLSAQLPRRPRALHRVHRNTSINSDPEESLTDRLNGQKNKKIDERCIWVVASRIFEH